MEFKLSLKIAKIAKEVNPKILTVMGGPHCRSDNEGMKNFLKKYPQMNSTSLLKVGLLLLNLLENV